MLELRLIIDSETTLSTLREFIKRTEDVPGDMPIAHYDIHDELDGVAIAFHPEG